MDKDSGRVCTRREFLRRSLTAGAAAAAACGLGYALHGREKGGRERTVRLQDFGVPPREDGPRVVAGRGGDPAALLRKLLDPIGGIGRFIRGGDRVLVKPNVAFASPPPIAATTNPVVVAAVVGLCLEAGAESVAVADNPINEPESCFALSGIGEAAEKAGARVLLPKERAFREVEAPGNAVIRRWPFFYEPFRKATKLIGVPATKQHSLCAATLGMKNWYGLLGGRRNRLHQRIDESIADLASLVRPTLTVLDATRVLFRHGPTGGNLSDVREEGILAVATDPVALDAFGVSLLGLKPEEVPYLALAERRGLGTTDLRKAGFIKLE